jgi:hypothetical protein
MCNNIHSNQREGFVMVMFVFILGICIPPAMIVGLYFKWQVLACLTVAWVIGGVVEIKDKGWDTTLERRNYCIVGFISCYVMWMAFATGIPSPGLREMIHKFFPWVAEMAHSWLLR